ncbi:MAG: hypothetical protein H0W84_11685 [Bacteroidetes bacterium]|nr:hypothetical protein [Bacteroidota bacterium]
MSKLEQKMNSITDVEDNNVKPIFCQTPCCVHVPSEVSVKTKFTVQSISSNDYKEWLIKKHYAKRMPIIEHSFGLYDVHGILQGVCCFGPPPRFWNNGGHLFNKKHEIKTYELNRLVINQGCGVNALSFFVGQCLRKLPKPYVVISYADPNNFHCGYIYQATNFIYTGLAEPKNKSCDFILNGNKYHGRNFEKPFVKKILGKKFQEDMPLKKQWIEAGGQIIYQHPKHRYIYINSKNRRKLIEDMIYKIEKYPKETNQNYDATYSPSIQTILQF